MRFIGLSAPPPPPRPSKYSPAPRSAPPPPPPQDERAGQPPTDRRLPVAVVGSDEIIDEGTSFTLDGSASYDPGGSRITYAWRQTGGVSVTLNNVDTAKATFDAPSRIMTDKEIFFELTVTNVAKLSGSAEKRIKVRHVALAPSRKEEGNE